MRKDNRENNELRPTKITRHFLDQGEGSVLIEAGKTRVLCVASVTEGVPKWRLGSGAGWVSAEYAMLPRATDTRNARESVRGKIGGRTHEISRLIGRALRASVDLKALGEVMIQIDCDVLQADGGTRTASITGAWVALADAIAWGQSQGIIPPPRQGSPIITSTLAAISVGIIDGEARLDLPYEEDSRAQTDMNVVATDSGKLVEIQGTAEGAAFSRTELDALVDLAFKGIGELNQLQKQCLSLKIEDAPVSLSLKEL